MVLLDTQAEAERRKILFQDYLHSDDYQKRLIQRLQINDAALKKTEAKILTYQLCERPDNPAEGCIFFIENFGWTFDPRPQADPNNLPFVLFDYQKDLIRYLIDHIDKGQDCLTEKSRDMGASWLIFVYVPLWYWLFKDGSNFLLGSYKEDLVDNRTRDSLFGMIDYAISNLPKWILPKGFNFEKHRNHMKLLNPTNFNQITGDTMNPRFGRGTRKTAILYDELGFWNDAKDAWESGSDATSCRIANSTPNGYNYYAQLRNSGIDVKTLSWRQHPLKDQQWYEYEKERRTPEEVAQELDISYIKSLEGRVYPEWDEASVKNGPFPYDHQLPLFVGWDFGRDDGTAIIWSQKDHHDRLRIIDTYYKTGKTIEFFVPFATGIITGEHRDKYTYTPEELKMIEERSQWRNATHFGDPSGRFRTQTSDYSVMDILKNNGVHINARDEWKSFLKRKREARLLILNGIDLNSNARSAYFEMCITQAAYPRVRKEGSSEINSKDPVHNWTSHHRSAFEYLSLGLSEFKGNQSGKPKDKFPVGRFNQKRVVGY